VREAGQSCRGPTDEGVLVGVPDGRQDGTAVGASEGPVVGLKEGARLGPSVGRTLPGCVFRRDGLELSVR
jgi:hypothetical protein